MSCPQLSAAVPACVRSVVAVSGLADVVLRSSAAQQWTSQVYPRPPGE